MGVSQEDWIKMAKYDPETGGWSFSMNGPGVFQEPEIAVCPPPPPDMGGLKTFDNPNLRLSQESVSLDEDKSADVSMVQLQSTEKTGLSSTLKYDHSLRQWSRYDEKLGEWTILCQEAKEEADKR